MEWWKNLNKESQRLLVGACIFCGSLVSLIFGASISRETVYGVSIPMVLIGILGSIVGGFCLIMSLIDWWERK